MLRPAVLLCIFFIINIPLSAQAPQLLWEQSFGGAGLDHAKCIRLTSDSGLIVAGYTRSNDRGINNHGAADQQDGWVLRLDKQGRLLWQQTFGGSADDELTCIQQTADGGYITAGFTRSADGDVTANHGQADLWVLKLAPDGHIQWQQTYGGSLDEVAYAIQPTKDGGYFAAGFSASSDGDVSINYGQQDYWLLKIDAQGVITWQKSFGNAGMNIANSLQQTFDGGYIVAGVSTCIPGDHTMSNQHGGTDNWVIKVTDRGVPEWEKAFGGSSADVAKSIIQASDSTYIVAGSTSSDDGDITGAYTPPGLDAWVYCLSPNGALKWQKVIGGSGIDGARTITRCRDGGFLIGGSTSSNDGDLPDNRMTAADYLLTKLNAEGKILWSKNLGSTGEDNAAGALETPDGGYVIAGDAALADKDISVNYGGDDLWVAKLAFPEILYPDNCAQARIYPNPCSALLRVNLAAGWEHAKLRLIGIMGQTVFESGDGGAYRVIDLEAATRGLYMLTLVNDDGKMCHTRVMVR